MKTMSSRVFLGTVLLILGFGFHWIESRNLKKYHTEFLKGRCSHIQARASNDDGTVPESKVCPRVNFPWPEVNLTDAQKVWLESVKSEKVTSSASIKSPRRTRKDIRYLSEEEFSNLVDAIYNLKYDFINGSSKYEIFMNAHISVSHDAPLFYTWHREYLLRMENALREYKDTITIPYWDVSADSYLPEAKDSVVWSADIFGNGDGLVATGKFAAWHTVKWDCESTIPGDGYIWRDVGSSYRSYQYNDKDMKFVWTEKTFHTFNVDAICFNLLHGSMHNFVGGIMAPQARRNTMRNLGCDAMGTVNPLWDPMFLFFHAFIDYVYSQFRVYSQTTDVESDWIDNDMYSNCEKLDDQALTFESFTMRDLLKSEYEAIYGYEVRNLLCLSQADCTSEHTWCSYEFRRCLSKIVDGGNCTGASHYACASGTCESATQTCSVRSKLRIID